MQTSVQREWMARAKRRWSGETQKNKNFKTTQERTSPDVDVVRFNSYHWSLIDCVELNISQLNIRSTTRRLDYGGKKDVPCPPQMDKYVHPFQGRLWTKVHVYVIRPKLFHLNFFVNNPNHPSHSKLAASSGQQRGSNNVYHQFSRPFLKPEIVPSHPIANDQIRGNIGR
jgi:hypothetical protein